MLLLRAWADEPAIWFCPLDSFLRPEVGYSGSPEYMELFWAEAPWETAASRVNVFKIYPQWINRASDADLERQFADLKRRGIALALEYGSLSESDECGRGVEGFGGRSLLNAGRRIRRLGGELRYVALDEPVFFGSLYQGRNSCRWTVEEVARNAAVNLKALLAEFPDVMIGDIEPLPVDDTSRGWLAQYARGLDAFQSALGFPLAFFHADVLWFSDKWQASLAAMRQEAQVRGIPFGVIYNGEAGSRSDAAWVASAEAHMTEYELAAPPPDQVIFQSWHAFPRKLLPESDTGSFTALINRYFRARPRMEVSLDESKLSGSLWLADVPVAGAAVRVTATPLSGEGFEAGYVLEGITPPEVTQIVLGARVNLECGCSAASEFWLRSFRLETAGAAPMVRDFAEGFRDWSISDRSLVSLRDGGLQARVPAGQPLLINSAPVAFARENSPFRLTVTARVKPESLGSGYFTLIFLAGKEISRVRIPIRAPESDIATPVTSDDGSFEVQLPRLASGDWLLRALFRGDAELWPARAELNVQRD